MTILLDDEPTDEMDEAWEWFEEETDAGRDDTVSDSVSQCQRSGQLEG